MILPAERPPFTPIFHQKRIPDTFFKIFIKIFYRQPFMTRFGRVESLQIPDNVRLREGAQWSRERRGRSSWCGRRSPTCLSRLFSAARGGARAARCDGAGPPGGGPPPCRRTAVRTPAPPHSGFPVRRDGRGICGAGVALLRVDLLRQRRIIASSAFAGYFLPIHRLEKFEVLRSRWRLCRLTDAACPLRVHKVHLHFSSLVSTKNL